MRNSWLKAEKQIQKGLQPEEGITFEYRADKKKPYWRARIRSTELKKYGISSRSISSKNYDTMDAFYWASVNARNELKEQIKKIKEAEKSGLPVNLQSLKSKNQFQSHSLDMIMGYQNGSKQIQENNDFDDIFASSEKYTTVMAARYKYLNYIQPDFGSRTVESITTEEIEQNLIESGKRLSSKAVNSLKSVWNKIFIVARRKDYRKDNPVQDVVINTFKIVDQDAARERLLGTKKERRRVDDETFNKVLDIVLKPKKNNGSHSQASVEYNQKMLAHALIVMRNTGMRPAECFALQKQDITIERQKDQTITGGSIYIVHACARGKHSERYIHETKTETSMAEIAINKEASETLVDMLQLCKTRKLYTQYMRNIYNEDHSRQFRNEDFLFTDFYGNLESVSKVGERLHKWIRKEDPTIQYSMYTNRHQFITDVSKTSLATAQSLARHANESTTLSYIEESDEEMNKAISGISSGFLKKIKNF